MFLNGRVNVKPTALVLTAEIPRKVGREYRSLALSTKLCVGSAKPSRAASVGLSAHPTYLPR